MTAPLTYSPALQADIQLPDRAETLRQIESGELESIEFNAAVFAVDKPNRNGYLFHSDTDWQNFAAGFTGKAFVKDHREDLDNLYGSIANSWLEDGKIMHAVKLTTRQAMTDFVEGKVRRFSISWFFDKTICSICGNDFTSRDCSHWPGRTYRVDDQDAVMQLIFVNPSARHTAAVSVPASPDTGLLAALTAAKKEIIGAASDAVINAPRAYQPPLIKGDDPMTEPKQGAETQEPDPRQEQLEANRQAIAQLQGETQRQQELNKQLQESEEILIASCAHLLEQGLAASRLPDITQDRIRNQFSGRKFAPAELTAAIEEAKAEVAALTAGQIVNGPARRISAIFNGEDQLRAAMDDLLGAPRDPDKAALKVAPLSGIREAYLLLTGDRSFTGALNLELAQLATTANFPAIVKDSMNKVLTKAWEQYGQAGYDWWTKIVTVEHFTDLKEVDWLMLGTIGSLPSISERGEYQPLVIGDNNETSDWTKYGGYVPLTLEALMRDDTRAFAQLPREVALGGMRNISEQVAAIFTANNGSGAALADGGALFNATAVTTAGGHANLLTTALGTDYTAWDAIALAMYNQPMHVAGTIEGQSYLGTGKPQAIEPKYCLVPRALKSQAQALFAPRWASIVESVPTKGGPTWAGEVEVVTVPEWTDANDYAAVIDPQLVPGIMLGEVFGVMPQIFIAGSENDPAMFMNDESRIKVRQFLTLGIANYRALHKSNVA